MRTFKSAAIAALAVLALAAGQTQAAQDWPPKVGGAPALTSPALAKRIGSGFLCSYRHQRWGRARWWTSKGKPVSYVPLRGPVMIAPQTCIEYQHGQPYRFVHVEYWLGW
jgi:hypothetical protein